MQLFVWVSHSQLVGILSRIHILAIKLQFTNKITLRQYKKEHMRFFFFSFFRPFCLKIDDSILYSPVCRTLVIFHEYKIIMSPAIVNVKWSPVVTSLGSPALCFLRYQSKKLVDIIYSYTFTNVKAVADKLRHMERTWGQQSHLSTKCPRNSYTCEPQSADRRMERTYTMQIKQIHSCIVPLLISSHFHRKNEASFLLLLALPCSSGLCQPSCRLLQSHLPSSRVHCSRGCAEAFPERSIHHGRAASHVFSWLFCEGKLDRLNCMHPYCMFMNMDVVI